MLLLGGGARLPVPHHPHDIIDCIAVSPTFAEDRTVFATSDGTLNLVGRSDNGGFTWRDVRSGLTGKHVYGFALAEDFAKTGRAFAATGGDGISWTANHGESWARFRTTVDARLLASLPFAEQEKPTLYVAGQGGLFLLRGPDDAPRELDPTRFKANPPAQVAATGTSAETAVVFVATPDRRLHASVDGGSSWSTLQVEADVRGITFSPRFASDRTVWLATFGAGVLVSRDAGASFTAANEGLTDPDVNDVAVPRRWPECQELFAATRDAGLFRSKDGGKSWQLLPLASVKTYQTDNHYRQVRLAPDYPTTPVVYCATYEGLYFSIDGGSGWIKSNINPTRYGRRIVFSPDFAADRTVFASGYGMLLAESADAGSTWSFGAVGVRALSTYALSVAPTWKKEGLLILGINEGLWRSRDRGATWAKLAMDPFERPTGGRVDHDITQVVFSPEFEKDRTCLAISFGGVYISTDAAETFRCVPPPVQWASVIAISPEFPRDRVVLVAGGRISRSADGGETWSEELTKWPAQGFEFAPDWATSKEVYAWSAYTGFARSTDGGMTWKVSNEGLEGHRPTGVRLDPRFASNGTMYMTTFGGGLFKSVDRGLSWRRHGDRNPRLDHGNTLAISPAFDRDHTMFVGNFEGIWRSTDEGATFSLTTSHEIYDQAREPWRYTAKWIRPDRKGAFGGTVDFARARGAAATMPFVGREIRVRGSRGPDHGKAEIWIDGRAVTVIDCYAENAVDSTVIFESEVPWGYHVMSVRVTGEKSAASKDCTIGVDAAEVGCVGPDGPVPVFSTQ